MCKKQGTSEQGEARYGACVGGRVGTSKQSKARHGACVGRGAGTVRRVKRGTAHVCEAERSTRRQREVKQRARVRSREHPSGAE